VPIPGLSHKFAVRFAALVTRDRDGFDVQQAANGHRNIRLTVSPNVDEGLRPETVSPARAD